MLRLQKSRPRKSAEKIDFKFSQFKALQVPRGWDNLFVSLLSAETGRTVAKSSKAPVRNGSCQWQESLSESFRISQDDCSKRYDDCIFKLLVAMGSARSGILGEAMVNMADFTESSSPVAVSLPLRKCNGETILQVKIQCLTPTTKLSGGDLKKTKSHGEDLKAYNQDVNSDGSNGKFDRTSRCSSVTDLGSSLNSEEAGRRVTSFSATGSPLSFDSPEGSVQMENSSPRSSLSGERHGSIGRQDSISSRNGAAHFDNPAEDPSRSSISSTNSLHTGSGIDSQNGHLEFAVPSFADSSRNLPSSADDAVDELRAEAKMWEGNARKLMVELDMSRKAASDHASSQANLSTELLAAYAECDGLKKEVQQLKLLLDSSKKAQKSWDSSNQYEGIPHIQKEMKDELKFQKESNADLALQLERSQESNLELVSVLQDLEETVEKQKMEMENLVNEQERFNDMEKSIEEYKAENGTLLRQLQQLQESEKNLLEQVLMLELDLKERYLDAENVAYPGKSDLKGRNNKLLAEEMLLISKENLSKYAKQSAAEVGYKNPVDTDLVTEIQMLREKVDELEKDCQELTDENLDLLYKLKHANDNMGGHATYNCIGNEALAKSLVDFEFDPKEQRNRKEDMEEKNNRFRFEIEENDCFPSRGELELKVIQLRRELSDKGSEIQTLESNLLAKQDEIRSHEQFQSELQAKCLELQKGKEELEEQIEVMLRENKSAQIDRRTFGCTVDSHVSESKYLDKTISELESEKRELELCISELEQENMQLSLHVTDLEAQLRYIADEKKSIRSELENSKSRTGSLQVEMSRLIAEMETEKSELEEKLINMQKQCSEAQEQYESLKIANPKSQGPAESLIEECSSLRKSNKELQDQKVELDEYCCLLDSRLKDSNERSAECFRRVEKLEEKFSLVLSDLASKGEDLASALDVLVEENGSLLNQMHLEKIVEVEKLQEEVEHLTKQLSATKDERKRMVFETMQEVSALRADKAKLESALCEVQSVLKVKENEHNALHMRTKTDLQGLMDELAVCRQNQEMLMSENSKMLKLLENCKTDEVKFKTIVNDLELKLATLEFERQKTIEEATNLKLQLQETADLQKKVLDHKNRVDEVNYEKGKLEADVTMISKQVEDMKTEKSSLVEKISTLQLAASELEDCKRSRISLEEMLLRIQGELAAKEEEKNECTKRSQSLEAELKRIREEQKNQRESGSIKVPGLSKSNTKSISANKDLKIQKNDRTKINGNHESSRKKPGPKLDQSQRLVKDTRHPYGNQYERKENGGNEMHDESHDDVDVDPLLRIQLLETQLAEAVEENNQYKLQLSRLSAGGGNSEAEGSKISLVGSDLVTRETFERTKSSLEAELFDIRERYFHMSLQYAEVESQREQLVMKLKTVGGKRWFS